MDSYTIITVMLGMNRFHQKDTEHPFDMNALDGYNTIWLPHVQEIEKTNSSLFYEVLTGVEQARTSNKAPETKDNYVFIFGRGTIGSDSEECLFEALQQTMQYYGNNVNHIIVAKSFGVGDTLTALSFFKPYHKKPNIQALILIDGFLPPSKKRKLAVKFSGASPDDLWRFKIPKYAKRYYNVVQRTKGTKGRLIVEENRNLVVRQDFVNKYKKCYDHYSDGYKRELEVSHFNMEEIVSIIPCIRLDANFETLPMAVEKTITTYI